MLHLSQPQRKRHQMQTWIRHRPKKKNVWGFCSKHSKWHEAEPENIDILYVSYANLALPVVCFQLQVQRNRRPFGVQKLTKDSEVDWSAVVPLCEWDRPTCDILLLRPRSTMTLFLLPQLLHIWHFSHYVQGRKKTAAHKCWCLYLSLYDWRWFLLLYTINEFGPEHYCHCFMGLSRRYVYLLSVILFYFLWPSCHTHQH